MQKIKNIIFDLGGVFLNLNYQFTKTAFTNLGIANFDELFTQHHANILFEDLETGKISPQQFYQLFREQTQTQIADKDIEYAWNALLLSFPKERIDWLTKMKSKYNVFLFSNTNEIHYNAFIDIFKRDISNTKDFNSLFIKAYYSHTLGLRKPYSASFNYILQEQNLIAEETLFIDDTLQNVEAAKALGMQTIYLQPPTTILDLGL